MSYFSSGGIFAGLDDNTPVLSGAPSTRHLSGLGSVPPGTTNAQKDAARKSYYYIYTLSTLIPPTRDNLALFLFRDVANITNVVDAVGTAITKNAALHATLWYQKSAKQRDTYIQGAVLVPSVKAKLRRAAARMDAVVRGLRTPTARNDARARAYFQDFIATGRQANLKSLNSAQQAAFGKAYIAEATKRRMPPPPPAIVEQEAMAAGMVAASKIAAAQQKAQGATAARQAAQKAGQDKARGRQAVAQGVQARGAARNRSAQASQKLARLRAQPATSAVALKAAERELMQAQTQEAQAEQQVAAAEQQLIAMEQQEQQALQQASVFEAQVAAEVAPSPAEQAEAAAQDSAENLAQDAVDPSAIPGDLFAEAGAPAKGIPVGLIAAAAAVGFLVIRGVSK